MKRNALLSLFLLLLLPAAAFAHGGQYSPPGPGGRGADSGGQVPPGTSDPPDARKVVTRWEAWWAANKESYLRLGERMREARPGVGVTTPGGGDEVDPRIAAEERVRESLVPLFIEALGDDYFDVRTAAAIALGKTEDARGLRPLMEAARKDGHKEVREAATLGLGLLGKTDAVPFLDLLMGDPKGEQRQRAFAAFSLGLIGGEDSAASLLRFIDPDQGPKYAGGDRRNGPLMASVFVALGLTGHASAPAKLRAALESSDYDDTVHSFVILSLGRVGDRDSLDRLTGMLRRESDAMLRRSAAIAVGRIATEQDQESVDALFSALTDDKDPVTRHFASIALAQLDKGKVRARLRARFPRSDLMDRPFVALALGICRDRTSAEMLRKAVESSNDESERSALCLALALMGDKEAVPLLTANVERRGRPWLQSYSAIGLGLLDSQESIPLLSKKLDDSNESRIRMNLGVALGLLKAPEAEKYFRTTLKGDGSIYERSSAAMSLAVLRVNAAMPDMVDLYRDPKEKDMVRAFAIVALGVLAEPAKVPKLARIAIDHNYSISVDPLDEVLSIL